MATKAQEPTTTEGRWLLWGPFVICPLLFFTDLTRNPYYTQIALLNIFICLYWLISLAQGVRRGSWAWTSTVLDLPIFALLGVCLLSWGLSFLGHPRLHIPIYSEGSRATIFLVVNVVLAYAAAVRAQDRTFVTQWIYVVYLTATFAAVYGLAQYFGVEWFWPHNLNPYGNRPVSTFGNPNFMSSYLVVVLPIMFADFVAGITKAPKPFMAFALLACTGALLATLTRSSWLGALIGLGFVMPYALAEVKKRPMLRNWLIVMAVIVLGAIVFWPKGPSNGYSTTVIERLEEVRHVQEGKVQSVSQRFLIWVCSWEMVLRHPVLGTGFGCFELFYPFFQGTHLLDPMFNPFRTHANNSHNEIMEYWAQVGTVGLGVVVWLWAVFFAFARSLGRRQEGPWRAFHWALAGGVAGMLADNLLNVSVHFAVPAFTFWWIVGTLFALGPGARTVRPLPIEKTYVRGLMIGAQIVLALFIVRAGCLWAEEIYFFKGFKLSKASLLPQAQESLEKAYAWHALDVNNNYELANVYARSSQPEKAVAMFQRALDANAGYDEIYFNRATVAVQIGKIEEAIHDYQLTIAINPLSHDAYNALAGLYIKDMAHHAESAEQLYERAVRAFPNDKDFWNNLGYVETQREKWVRAGEAYRHALEIDPDFELGWRNLRQITPHLPPTPSDPFLNQGAIFQQADKDLALGHPEEGLKTLEPLKAVMPNGFRLHFYLGNMMFALKRYDEAVAHYRAAIALHTDNAPLWQNLGAAEEQAGHLPQAREAFDHALQLEPKNDKLRAHANTLPMP